ncbi:MAG: hypothetical protein WCL39_14610, partial [Armatimonadota bacterium]
MKTTVINRLSVALVLFMTLTCCTQAASNVYDDFYTASAQFVTAFPGGELDALGHEQTVWVSRSAGTKREALHDAWSKIATLPNQTRTAGLESLDVRLRFSFTVAIQWTEAGSVRSEILQIKASALPGNQSVGPARSIADPPSYVEFMANVPATMPERVVWLKERLRKLVEPLVVAYASTKDGLLFGPVDYLNNKDVLL